MAAKNLSELLVSFDNAIGITGYETEISRILKEEMEGYYDDWFEDVIGNQIFVNKGKTDKKIMLAAHIDELGFMVSFIEDSGMVRFVPLGLHDDRMVIDQDLTIHTEKGDVFGITGGKPAHILTEEEQSKTMKIASLFIDVGTSSKEETEKLGVQVGDVISFNRKGFFLNGSTVYSGKAVDDRSGTAIMVEVMRRLKKEKIDNITVYAVGTVQEELGVRGAGVVAHRIKPDIAIAFDVTLAGGTPGFEPHEIPIKLGGGAAIKIFDWAFPYSFGGNAVPKKLSGALIKIAEEHKIKYQREVLMQAMTDAAAISLAGDGVLSGAISIPSRYIHSAVGVVDIKDMEACVELVVQYIKSL